MNNGDAGGDSAAIVDGDAMPQDAAPPTWPAGATLAAIGGIDRVVFSWPSAIDDVAVTSYRVRREDGTTQTLAADVRSFTIDGLALDATASLEVQAGDGAGNWSTALRATGTATVPDPTRTAPPLGPFEGGPVATHARFLFEGNPPVQVGVRDGAVDPQRIAVVRGRVIDRAGMPVRRVRVSVHGASELGYTLTRDDGRYDLVVNGGGAVTIVAEHSTILTAQRRADPSWQGMVDLPDLVVTTRDATVIPIDTSGTQAASQTVRGTEVRDAMGTRRPLLYVRPATRAELVMPDGSTRAAPSLRVHITEFTAGANARNAMPGDLPPNTAFTYAADLVAEEAEAVGARSVRFSVPVRYYIEPTINVPVGSAVPLGFFERSEDRWRAEDSGVVLRVLTVTGGIAALDTNGDSVADDAARLAMFEIDEDERRAIAANYTAGATLWRMKLGHFSLPDFNFMRWFAGLFSTPPERPTPIAPSECRSTRAGSIVYCESQVLGERVPVAGSGVFLHYQSDRVPGFVRGYTIKIPLTGPTVEPTLRGVQLEVTTAGQVFRRS